MGPIQVKYHEVWWAAACALHISKYIMYAGEAAKWAAQALPGWSIQVEC